MPQGHNTSCRTTRPTHLLVVLSFPLIGLLLYGHTLQAPFYLDDFINIRDNLYTIEAISLEELFNASFKSFAHRRPLANLSFALNYYFHGYRLPGYHLVNIVIHVINGILLYVFVFKTLALGGQNHQYQRPMQVATLASLLWFVNPIQIQAVTYTVQRMTGLATLFFLCSFLSYIYARLAQKTRTRVALFGLSALYWILAMASKEIALTLPVLVFVYEWFFFQDLDRTWLRKSAVYLVTGLAGLLAAVYLVYHYTPLDLVTAISQPRQYTALERFLTQGRIIFIYISLLLHPHPARLNLSHDISVSRGLLDPLTTLFSFVGLVALFLLTLLMAKRYRLVTFCIIWFFAGLGIEALAASIEPMFEHRTYLPSMLFFLPFVWIAFKVVNKPKIVVPAITAFGLVMAVWTYQRNALWNDSVAFWQDAAEKSPDHYRTHANLGVSLLGAKQYDRALRAFQKALTLKPPYPTEIYTNIGVLYSEIGQQDLARRNLDHALLLNPNNHVALDLLGTIERKRKNSSEALKQYQRAIKINPNFAPSHYNLGVFYVESGDLDSAVKSFGRALALRPMWSQAYSGLGLARAKQAHYTLAISTLRKAVQIDVQNKEAFFNLANAYNLTGQYEMALQTYKTLLKINPKDVEAMHNVGMIYLKHLNNVQQAKLYFNNALSTDPDHDHAATVKSVLSDMGAKSSY